MATKDIYDEHKTDKDGFEVSYNDPEQGQGDCVSNLLMWALVLYSAIHGIIH